MPTFSQPTSLLDTIKKKQSSHSCLGWVFSRRCCCARPTNCNITRSTRSVSPTSARQQRPDTRSAQTRPSKTQRTRSTTASVAQACWASFFSQKRHPSPADDVLGRARPAASEFYPRRRTGPHLPRRGSKIDRSSVSDPALYPRFSTVSSLPPAKTDHGTRGAADVCPERAYTLLNNMGSPSTRAWRPRWLNQPVVPALSRLSANRVIARDDLDVVPARGFLRNDLRRQIAPICTRSTAIFCGLIRRAGLYKTPRHAFFSFCLGPFRGGCRQRSRAKMKLFSLLAALALVEARQLPADGVVARQFGGGRGGGGGGGNQGGRNPPGNQGGSQAGVCEWTGHCIGLSHFRIRDVI